MSNQFQNYPTTYNAPTVSDSGYQPTGQEMCTRGCGQVATQVRSSSAKNPGRMFWGCQARCDGFGGWVDEGPPKEPFAKSGGYKRKATTYAENTPSEKRNASTIQTQLAEMSQQIAALTQQVARLSEAVLGAKDQQ